MLHPWCTTKENIGRLIHSRIKKVKNVVGTPKTNKRVKISSKNTLLSRKTHLNSENSV